MKTEILFKYGNTINSACKLLNESIQEYIEKGYIPQGGVSISIGENTNTISGSSSACILMIKKDDDEI